MINFVLEEEDASDVTQLLGRYKETANNLLKLARVLENAPVDLPFEDFIEWTEESNQVLAGVLLLVNGTREKISQKYRKPDGTIENRDRIPL